MNNVKWLVPLLVFFLSLPQGAAAQKPGDPKLRAADVQAKWSSTGRMRTPFHNCISISEPGDPDKALWADNYLCFNRKDHGFRYSYTGPIQGMHCENLNIKAGVWQDNYLCSNNTQFAWFPRKLKRGYICIRIIEPQDPDPRANGKKRGNAFCIKK